MTSPMTGRIWPVISNLGDFEQQDYKREITNQNDETFLPTQSTSLSHAHPESTKELKLLSNTRLRARVARRLNRAVSRKGRTSVNITKQEDECKKESSSPSVRQSHSLALVHERVSLKLQRQRKEGTDILVLDLAPKPRAKSISDLEPPSCQDSDEDLVTYACSCYCLCRECLRCKERRKYPYIQKLALQMHNLDYPKDQVESMESLGTSDHLAMHLYELCAAKTVLKYYLGWVNLTPEEAVEYNSARLALDAFEKLKSG